MSPAPGERRLTRFICTVQGKPLVVPFDASKSVAEFRNEIEKRARRQLGEGATRLHVARLHARSDEGPELSVKNATVRRALGDDTTVFVATTGGEQEDASLRSPAERTTSSARLALNVLKAEDEQNLLLSLTPYEPAAYARTGRPASRPSSARGRAAKQPAPQGARASAASTRTRPSSAGARGRGGGHATPSSAPSAGRAAPPRTAGSEGPPPGLVSVLALMRAADEAPPSPRSPHATPRTAWAAESARAAGGGPAAEGAPAGSDPAPWRELHPLATAESGAEGAHGAHSPSRASPPHPRSPGGTPAARADSGRRDESGGAEQAELSHEAEQRLRAEIDNDVMIARRKALQRFPTGARTTLGRRPSSAGKRSSTGSRGADSSTRSETARLASAGGARTAAAAAAADEAAQQVSQRERFLETLTLEAHTASDAHARAAGQAPPKVPAWKTRVLERIKVTALSPGRQPPRIFRPVDPKALEPKIIASRARSAGRARAAAKGRAEGAVAPRGAGGADAPPADEYDTRRLSASASISRITSSPYVLQGVRELEAVVTGEGLALRGSDDGGGAGEETPRSPASRLAAAAAGPAARAGSKQHHHRQHPSSPAAIAALASKERERRLYYYTDALAKQELEAYYLGERHGRLKEQLEEKEARDAEELDPRLAQFRDRPAELDAAAHKIRQRLFHRVNLCEVRVNETLATHRVLREKVNVLRKQRMALLRQLQRAQRRAASLSHDLKFMAHVAHTEVDNTTKLESKLERTMSEFTWETEHYKRNVDSLDGAIHAADLQIVSSLERADAQHEHNRQEQWGRIHQWRTEEARLAGRHGFMRSHSSYLDAKFRTVCNLVHVKFDGLLEPSTTAEVLAAHRSRETLNTSLWRINDEQTLSVAALEAEVKALQHKEAELSKKEVRAFHADDVGGGGGGGGGLGDDYMEKAYEEYEVMTSEMEPLLLQLIEPMTRLFELLECYDTDQLSQEARDEGITRDTLPAYLHAVDVRVRELQLRAKKCVELRAGAEPSEQEDTLRAFVDKLKLYDAPRHATTSGMKPKVMSQVGRLETLLVDADG